MEDRMLRIEPAKLAGVRIIHPRTQFSDFRGNYTELYNKEAYRALGVTEDFVEDDVSVTDRHVLRGLHGDDQTTKLMSCAYGKVYVVLADNDPASAQFRQWEAFTLSAENKIQLLAGPKIAHGFLVLSDVAVYHYKQSRSYDRPAQFTVRWNDPAFAIWWPIANPILSRRDSGAEA
jgi:dTDP-4-dehydrorhamnose 3,5-epimerase